MNSVKTGKPSIGKIYNITFSSFKNYLSLLLPFIIFTIIELIVLASIYIAPRAPLRAILGPPIRTFWGEQFLHYPANFLLFPKLTYFSKLCLSVLFGSLLTGMVMVILFDVYNKNSISLKKALKTAVKKYILLFGAVFILAALLYIAGKIINIGLARYFLERHTKILFLKPDVWIGPVLVGINFVVSVFIQAAFIYVIPLLIFEKEKLLRAIFGSFVLFKRLFIHTIILVGLPMILYVPISILSLNTAYLINRLFPEFILIASGAGIVISSLVIDPLVTISTAYLYLVNKER